MTYKWVIKIVDKLVYNNVTNGLSLRIKVVRMMYIINHGNHDISVRRKKGVNKLVNTYSDTLVVKNKISYPVLDKNMKCIS